MCTITIEFAITRLPLIPLHGLELYTASKKWLIIWSLCAEVKLVYYENNEHKNCQKKMRQSSTKEFQNSEQVNLHVRFE